MSKLIRGDSSSCEQQATALNTTLMQLYKRTARPRRRCPPQRVRKGNNAILEDVPLLWRVWCGGVVVAAWVTMKLARAANENT